VFTSATEFRVAGSSPVLDRLEHRGLFGIITRQAIRRGTFTSVRHLIGAIETFIDAWNETTCEPFTWTKTADDILTKANRQKISDTRH
jgi:hypothetical protein